jgi:hypothetical protein
MKRAKEATPLNDAAKTSDPNEYLNIHLYAVGK